MLRGDLRSLLMLVVCTAGAVLLAAAWPAARVKKQRASLDAPIIRFDGTGTVSIEAQGASDLRYTLDGSIPNARSPRFTHSFKPITQQDAQQLVAIPTSVQWRHPIGEQPSAGVVRACAVDEQGRSGAIATSTFVPERHAGLAVLSLSLPAGAFFDPDTGLYVVGNAIFHTEEEFVRRYPEDQKWWKYPGNFHYRGGSAERTAHLEMFPPDAVRPAVPAWSSDVRLRINGNNTRGFPQHALRVLFDAPLDLPLFGEERGAGFERILLRTSGNDQDRTFFRDALQHRLCANLPFETSACVQSVLYVNGAYWGIHNVRERLDEKELARRYHVRAKDITILADRLELYEGDEKQMLRFATFLTRSEQWDANAAWFVDSLNAHMDLDGFLHYMAANIIFGNTDWPEQNGKWWCTSSKPPPGAEASGTLLRDRWHFIMGDSDLSFGMTVGPDYDMFAHIERRPTAPLSRLYLTCVKSPVLRERFRRITLDLLDGPLSAFRMTTEAERMRDGISTEMRQHVKRWRRPLTYETWQGHVEVLLTFAKDRGTAVRKHLDAHLPPGTRH